MSQTPHPTESTEGESQASDEQVARAMKAFHDRLKDKALKSTRQRDAIAECFFRLDKHITADELHAEAKKHQSRIGYATVYRTLKLLVEQGFAVEKDFGDGCKRYDPVHGQDPHHDHLICVDCRKVVEFNDDLLAQRAEALAQSLGYDLRRKRLELYAECRIVDCPNRPAPSAPFPPKH